MVLEKIGNEKMSVVDTWWQTETGGFMITPLPGATELKAGSATRPFFGVQPALVDNEGNPLEGATERQPEVITDSWPGQARTLFGDHERFEQTYFSTFKNMYSSGDGARRDEDGLLLDHRACGRRAERLRSPSGGRQRLSRRWWRIRRLPKPP